MNSVSVLHYEAFSVEKGKGNPAGIVLEGERYTEEEMQRIAFHVGFNETSFILPSEVADLRIRYFTPGHEMNLCGHARGLLSEQDNLTIETKAGILPIKVYEQSSNYYINMKQITAQFKPFNGSIEDLAKSIGLDESEIAWNLPVMYGSTGIWTLLVPIKTLSSFHKMKPVNEDFPKILQDIPTASVHPFCLETINPIATMHGRHFLSPHSGTMEDPVTGTASGVMGAYYAKFIKETSIIEPIIVEQGQEIGKDGQVIVHIKENNDVIDVEISGTAVYMDEYKMNF